MSTRHYGQAYNLFILVLTVISQVVMVLLWLPLSAETIELLRTYDNLICSVFVLDFCVAVKRAESPRAYLVGERGWLDLLGCMPTFGIEALGLLRLARLNRLRQISRRLGTQSKSQLIADLLRNRAQYALVTTCLAAFLVMSTASVVVLEAESRVPGSNIRSGADAFWWAVVTITTVGYGDHFPTTAAGRAAAMFLMLTGIGIIASLASVMGRMLLNPQTDIRHLERTLDSLLDEVTALRQRLDADQPNLHSMDGPSALARRQSITAPRGRSPDQ